VSDADDDDDDDDDRDDDDVELEVELEVDVDVEPVEVDAELGNVVGPDALHVPALEMTNDMAAPRRAMLESEANRIST